MSEDDKNGFTAGIYRNLEKIAPLLARIADALEAGKKPAEPREQTLPGLPAEDWTPPAIEVKPREWSNTVKVYDVIHEKCGTMMFSLSELIENAAIQDAIREATGGRVGVASYSKILSVLVRSGVMERHGRFGYIMAKEPTDELREAVEQMAKKRAAAKEVTA